MRINENPSMLRRKARLGLEIKCRLNFSAGNIPDYLTDANSKYDGGSVMLRAWGVWYSKLFGIPKEGFFIIIGIKKINEKYQGQPQKTLPGSLLGLFNQIIIQSE